MRGKHEVFAIHPVLIVTILANSYTIELNSFNTNIVITGVVV